MVEIDRIDQTILEYDKEFADTISENSNHYELFKKIYFKNIKRFSRVCALNTS
jgi:hypothetical protein